MKLPVLPTIVVGLAAALMVALGIWQLDRRGEKTALIARYTANQNLPVIAFPRPGGWQDALFRRASAMCVSVTSWTSEAGRAVNGTRGWRKLATCTTGGAEGPGLVVDAGIASDPKANPPWRGGPITGTITEAPRHQSVLAGLVGRRSAATPMLILDTPAPGLKPSARPAPDTIPNNHLAYAVQWFLFAGIAVGIYLLALRRRQRG